MSRPDSILHRTSPSPEQLRAIADFFSVMADPTRLAILNYLRQGEASVSGIMGAVGLKQANTSKQLGILHRARLVAREPRGSQVVYSIAEPMLFDLCDLVCDKLSKDVQSTLQAFGRR